MSDWRSQYDDAASKEANRWQRASKAEMIEAVRRGATGEYYTIWDELGRRSPSAEVCWLFFDVLESDREYHDRYHCAAALIALLRITEIEPVALSAKWPELPGNLVRVRGIIEGRFGPRP